MQVIPKYNINQSSNSFKYQSNITFTGVARKVVEIPHGRLKRDTKFMVDDIIHAFRDIK